MVKPTSTTATLILKTSRHILLYPEQTELCKLLEVELFEDFSQLVSCLVEDYCELYKSIKGRTKYSDFQVKWLHHLYKVAEKGAALATSNAPDDDYTAILPTSLAAEQWSNIYISAHTKLGEVKSDTNLIVLHSIAKQMFNNQQERVIELKMESASDSSSRQPSSAPSPDDALLHMCGTEIARSLKWLQKEKIAKMRANQCDSVETIDKEIAFLKSMCIPNAEKSKHDDIPEGIKNLDSGYMWVPRPCLLPFLRKFYLIFWQQINESNYKMHGDALFMVSSISVMNKSDLLL